MNCLVTGATGLVGSNLAHELVNHGDDVTITCHEAEQPLPWFKGKRLYASFIGLDWDALGDVDVLFHQAAMNNTRELDRNEMMRANLHSSKLLFEKAIEHGCHHIVYASSTAIYGRHPAPYHEEGPFDLNTPYAESKKLMEEMANELAEKHPQVTFVGLRYCNVYGPGESHKGSRASMVHQLIQQMPKGDPRLFKWGEQKRDYIYVKDVVRANLAAAKAKENAIVNCGSGTATTFKRLMEILNFELGLERTPQYFDNPYEGNYQDHTECDMSLAKQAIGFVPEWTIEAGIHDMIRELNLK